MGKNNDRSCHWGNTVGLIHSWVCPLPCRIFFFFNQEKTWCSSLNKQISQAGLNCAYKHTVWCAQVSVSFLISLALKALLMESDLMDDVLAALWLRCLHHHTGTELSRVRLRMMSAALCSGTLPHGSNEMGNGGFPKLVSERLWNPQENLPVFAWRI